MAPEYVMHGNLSVKADVFSYGVLVLELITGHRNSSFNLDVDAQNMLDWVTLFIKIILYFHHFTIMTPSPIIYSIFLFSLTFQQVLRTFSLINRLINSNGGHELYIF